MDKRQLVDGCKRGDPASAEALYRGYSGKLMGICRHYVDSQEVAEDLLHDAFVVILSSIGQLRNPEKMEAWMGVIVKNLAIDYLKESQHFTHPEEDIDIEDVPEETVYPVPPYDDLLELIDRLPEQYGKVFRLSVLEGLSHKEIGALLHKETESMPGQNGPVAMTPAEDSVHVVLPVDSLVAPETPSLIESPQMAAISVNDTTLTKTDSSIIRERLVPIDIHPIPFVPLSVSEHKYAIRKQERQTQNFNQPLLAETGTTARKNLLGLLPSISALPSAIAGSSPIVMGSGILAQASSYILAPDTRVSSWDDFLTAVQSMEGHYRTGDSLAYYNSLLHIAERLAVPEAMDPNPKPVEEKAEYEKPFTLGLSTSIGLNDRWSVLTGLEYTRLRSTHSIGRDTLYIKNQHTIHYLGVPLGLSYTVWSKGNLNLNASAFGKMEIPVAGILNSEHHNGVAYTYQNTLRLKAPVQWSAGAGIGVQYNLTPWMGLYADASGL